MTPRIVSLLLVAPSLVHAAITLTGAGCASSAGFTTCQNAATAAASACLANADANQSQLETLACGCVNQVDNINCYATNCWNKVWECDYQEYVVEYMTGCPIAKPPVPYFPIPNNAPDSCSCNVGEIFLAITNSITRGTACSTNVTDTFSANSVQQVQGCECCEVSTSLSSIYGLCPSTNPLLIGLSSVNQIETLLDTPFDSCSSYLSEFPCGSLGFAVPAGGTFFSPANLPASGTATLSNIAGTVTSPASGSVFTWTDLADSPPQTYTITAAGLNGGEAPTSGVSGGTTTVNSGAATNTAGGSVGASGSGSATPVSTTTKPSSGEMTRLNQIALAFSLMVSITILWI